MLTLIVVLTRSQYFHFLRQIECSFRLVCRLKSIDNEETSLFGPTKPVEKQVTALLRENLQIQMSKIYL